MPASVKAFLMTVAAITNYQSFGKLVRAGSNGAEKTAVTRESSLTLKPTVL